MPINYIENDLNAGQREAVLYNEGASLVIAGAGSGKTRVLTYKIAYLLDNGYLPWNILALTFTNKAAREMRERITRFVGDRARGLWMGTFHSIFSRILRTEAETIGFTHNFTIYDAADSKSLLKSIIKEMGLDEKTYKPGVVQNHISNAKNHLILPSAYAANPDIRRADEASKIPLTADIYRRYWERCKQADAMDFDDLLVYTHILLNEYPHIRQKYSEGFKYVLVDEYQDTNHAQHSIVWLLTQERQRVCVVGDDAQSIYSFRGANIDNILKFTNLYKNARLFKLEQNYRSTQTIVQAANSLIAKNSQQIRKEVFSEKEKGEPIQVTCAYSDTEEGEIVANKITELHRRQDIPYSGIAILYRTNAQSRIFEEALRKRSIPSRIYGGLSFYQRREIKDAIAYFRMVVNPHDEEAFKRVINYPARGIGNTTLTKITEAATQNGISLWSIIECPLDYGVNINKGTATKLQSFRELIEDFIQKSETLNAYELGTEIIRQSGMMNDIINDHTPEGMSRKENIEELTNGIHDFCEGRREEGDERISLVDYLSEISLLTDQDTDDNDDGDDKVTLMTIHAAKGLEFNTVFIVGLEENLFPSPMVQESYRQLEEERRLFYVAITRAEEHCFFSFARNRFKYGKTEFSNPSRFLKDINPAYLAMQQGPLGGNTFGSPFRSFKENTEEPRRPFTSIRNYDDEENGFTAYHERTYSAGKGSSSAYPSHFGRGRESVSPVIPQGMKRVSSTVRSSGQGNPPTLQPGQFIEHERFGLGKILRVEGSGESCKATVSFQNAGEKQLLLKFARFKVIG